MKVKFIILGCGSSLGVPNAAGNWGNCNPRERKNYRTRCSALIKSKNKNILIDTSPDLRYQLLKNNISNIDRVFYSHKHADQVHGINDLRVFYLKRRKKYQYTRMVRLKNILSKISHIVLKALMSTKQFYK